MNDNYEKMKQSIINNLEAIKNLLQIAQRLQESLSEITDPELKANLAHQVDSIFESVSTLATQTNELFDAYKGLFKQNE